MDRAEIRLKNEVVTPLPAYLISRGVPMPPGRIREPSEVSVRDAAGAVLPSAGRVLQRRPDGSVEWLLLDILADLDGGESTSVFVEMSAAPQPPVANPVVTTETDGAITIGNGLTSASLPTSGAIFSQLTIAGRTVVAAGDAVDLEVVDVGGKVHRASLSVPRQVTVIEANPLRAVVRVEGTHTARDGETFLDYAMQITVTAGCPDLKLEHTFYCREARDGRIPVKAIRLVMPTQIAPDAKKAIRQSHHSQTWVARSLVIDENVEIVASALDNIDHYRSDYKPYGGRTHGSAGGKVFIRNAASLRENPAEYPFHMRPGHSSGFRAELQTGGLAQVHPAIGWQESDYTLVMAFERWAQLHPKSIALDENVATISIWPEWSVYLQLVQGVSKTHTLWFTGRPAALTAVEVEQCHLRWECMAAECLDISFDPAWPAYCQVLDCHEFLRYQPDRYPMLENLIESYPAAGNPNRFTYPRHDASGMLNYGDSGGAGGFTNNEDDVRVLAPLLDYLRTGNTYCLDAGVEAARHYMEVDWCEWSTDPRQLGGLIPHTVDHFVGNVYPSHQWAEGIEAYYYLTGDERARRVVLAVGDNNVYWVHNVLNAVCCDGREAGMPLVNLAAAYRLSRDERYIDAARVIIANFHQKWYDLHGDLKYPYPQSAGPGEHQKWMTGYGDWSSYSGLYRIWEVTQDESIRELLLALTRKFLDPKRFGLNDARAMDFFAVWIYIKLTGDDEGALTALESVIPMLLRRGGHPLRRLQFLAVLDKHGLIDERLVGNRAGAI